MMIEMLQVVVAALEPLVVQQIILQIQLKVPLVALEQQVV
jgi:hypothetical protein